MPINEINSSPSPKKPGLPFLCRNGHVQLPLPHNPFSPLPQTLYSLSPFSLTHHSLLTLTHLSTNPVKPRRLLTTQSKGDDSVDVPDRLIAAVCYFYPFFDGIQYGKYVITQFTAIQALINPLVPAIRVFKSFPFNGFLYVRFNTMQVIVLDVLLIFPDLLERSFNPRDGLGLDVLMSLDSTVFLFLLVCLIYASSSCLLGQVPDCPL
ncbi:putative chloroplast protein import component Tic20 [Rosa chinensis]|uniref:Protein TIC 20 n=1 Tax=Rosa chinensis TaxID=74649 RepID=A0A2P6QFC5_ROSCH|nr:putative chloroplast protein import component Tic20 [Rosa chinensis]